MAKTTSDGLLRLCWEQSRCSNCLSCVVVCAERHTGVSAPSRARIRMYVGLFDGSVIAEYCRQCPDAPCAAACPTEAISLDGQHHVWRVDEELCISCGECVEACPYHAIRLDIETDLAAKCDLCLGAARCVEVCPTGALTVEGEEMEPGSPAPCWSERTVRQHLVS